MKQDKLSLKRAVIVEGKYDKIKLEALIDGIILETRGFRIFKDKEMRELIRTLSKTRGIVVLTDSDAAGFKIRSFISGIINSDGDVVNAYIPDILGKEKRKASPSAEGKLGVEGMELDVLREALQKAGALLELDGNPQQDIITRYDFYNDGFLGGENSAELRRGLFLRLGLPARLSTSAALKLLNRMLTREEYEKLRDEVQR